MGNLIARIAAFILMIGLLTTIMAGLFAKTIKPEIDSNGNPLVMKYGPFSILKR